MRPAPVKSPTLPLGLVLAAVTGCSGAAVQTQAGHAPPAWFAQPPTSGQFLYFVGDARSADDETMARDLAIQKALGELSVYCGARVKSEFTSQDIEQNGVSQQSVSLTVDVAGTEMTIRRAVVKETSVGPGSDGRFDAFALVEWPRAEYENVLTAQRQRVERALTLYLDAERHLEAFRVAEARQALLESRDILGPMKAQLPLNHPTYTNSALLFEAVTALGQRLQALEQNRRQLLGVAVACQENGQTANCTSHREGRIRERVSQTGFRVSTAPVPHDIAERILTSDAPRADQVRSAGFVLAVRYDARLLATEDGFTFVRCGARGALYDTDANRIVTTTEVKPKKAGHVHFEGAVEKSCEKAEASVVTWIERELPGYRKPI